MSALERRRHPRFLLTSDVFVLDAAGNPLGRVCTGGAGGLLIEVHDARSIAGYYFGERTALTLVEPHTGSSSRVRVEVRYVAGEELGVQFV